MVQGENFCDVCGGVAVVGDGVDGDFTDAHEDGEWQHNVLKFEGLVSLTVWPSDLCGRVTGFTYCVAE